MKKLSVHTGFLPEGTLEYKGGKRVALHRILEHLGGDVSNGIAGGINIDDFSLNGSFWNDVHWFGTESALEIFVLGGNIAFFALEDCLCQFQHIG